MIGWRILSLALLIHCAMGVAFYATASNELQNDIPQLEEEEPSLEEQEMLDMFHFQEQTMFWQWMYRVGGVVVARYIVVKEAIKKRYGDFKEWLVRKKKYERKVAIVTKKK